MRHATAAKLAEIAHLLDELRQIPGLVERRPGVFYLKSKPLLHFHEDPAGMFADFKTGEGWIRIPSNTAEEQESLKLLANPISCTL